MQEQTTGRMPSAVALKNDRVKQTSESSSSRSSVSSWTEESSTKINIDVMTGHLILVSRFARHTFLWKNFFFF